MKYERKYKYVEVEVPFQQHFGQIVRMLKAKSQHCKIILTFVKFSADTALVTDNKYSNENLEVVSVQIQIIKVMENGIIQKTCV